MAATPAIPGESLVTAQRDLLDPEFSQARHKIAWLDREGGLWIADVDPATGLFSPGNGKGTLIDPAAMATRDLNAIGNGPEWIATATGDQIVYTKFLAGLPHVRTNARLALAQQVKDGSWRHGYLAPSSFMRAAPYASRDWRDPAPRISYVDPQGNHYWRNLDDPYSEQRVESYPASQYYYALRFADGARGASFPAMVDGVSQVFYRDLDAGTETQLTFDPGQKDLASRAWVWHAPEFGGDLAMFTVADKTELRVYRQSDGPTGWTLVKSVRTPVNGVINSPEYFIQDGASYIFFVASVPPAMYPSQVFLVDIDPANASTLQLSPDSPLRIRTDPEVFVTDEGPYIYYNRQTINAANDQYCLSCNEGIFRAYSGLVPQDRHARPARLRPPRPLPTLAR